MLLNSVVIVLREVLEAALLMSVLLAVSRLLKLPIRWAFPALIVGVLGASLYGFFLQPISELFDGMGQEIVNALLQFSVCALIAVIAFQVSRTMRLSQAYSKSLAALMVAIVAVAIIREGSEIFVYVSGFWGLTEFLSAVALGSVVGACLGLSIGVLVYYLLLALEIRRMPAITIVILALIAAGMASQAVRLLIQADWISISGVLWDTSNVLSEQSLVGQLAYALVGYEASPSAPEVFAYVLGVLVVAFAFAAGRFGEITDEDALE